MKATVPLPQPPAIAGVTAEFVSTGLPIPAIERLRIFSDRQWEEFVLEWADSLHDRYSRVERCGGAGDMGRDVVAFDKVDASVWDNFQCKHYRDPLTPASIWVELGKLVYYTSIGEYVYPRRYTFVAPQGAGTKLSNLLKKPAKLKAELVANWPAYCRAGITSTKLVELDAALTAFLDGLDFSIFDAIPPLQLLDQHARTRWHAARFGGGLPARPSFSPPPTSVAAHEINYVTALLNAYEDHVKTPVSSADDLATHPELGEHFGDSRLEFYSAEALRAFSRDTLPPNVFERLQDEFHGGIRDELRGEHASGYRCVLAVTKTARLLPMTSHPLAERLSLRDRAGICHQLANDKKVKWTR